MKRAVLPPLLAVALILSGLLGLSSVAWADDNDGSTIITVGGVSVDLCLVGGNESAIRDYVNSRNGSATDIGLVDVSGVLGSLGLDTRRQGCGDRDRDRDRRGPIVSNGGDCVTFSRENRDRGYRLNDSIRRYNSALIDLRGLSSDSGSLLTIGERQRLDLDRNTVARLRDEYNRDSDRYRTICRQEPQVVIIQQEDEDDDTTTVAPTTVYPPAPTTVAPAPSGGQVSDVPTGAPQAGDGSTAGDVGMNDHDRAVNLAIGYGALAIMVLGVLGLALDYWRHRRPTR